MGVRIQEVVIDCADPAALAAFWAQVLQARWGVVDEGIAVVDADPVPIAFQKVPEPKQSPKNRLHLDVQVAAAPEAVARAEALGARRTGQASLGGNGDGYVVLQDPEGNEFCFVVDEGGGWMSTLRAALTNAP
jgi:predicted enzyme related to lactoylglutathione lyase